MIHFRLDSNPPYHLVKGKTMSKGKRKRESRSSPNKTVKEQKTVKWELGNVNRDEADKRITRQRQVSALEGWIVVYCSKIQKDPSKGKFVMVTLEKTVTN